MKNVSDITYNPNINIFVSYPENAKERLNIPTFIQIMKNYPGISSVYSCDDIRDGSCLQCINISNLMEKIDFCIFFCCHDAYNSSEVCTEAKFALELNKSIIPVFECYHDIIPAFRHKMGVKIAKDNYNPQIIAEKIFEFIINGLKTN